MDMALEPGWEEVGVDSRYNWRVPLTSRPGRVGPRSVWYVGLPLTSAHRGSHSGGGALIPGAAGQDRYLNEGTVYPHASLMELITYHAVCFPDLPWRYVDLSHEDWPSLCASIAADPPEVVALTVYTATALWAFVVAAEVKRCNPSATVVFGNDHAGILYREILEGEYGRSLVDFVSTGNNGPFTMMGLLYFLQGRLELDRVPSVAYRRNGGVVNQAAPTFPLESRRLPDFRMIESYLSDHYDKAFDLWYADHYDLKRMITLPLDAGCHWGRHPRRRCKHCSIQGLTPKSTSTDKAVAALELAVGELRANVYAAGDSTLGFSRAQWDGSFDLLDHLALRCEASPILRGRRFMLAYGLISEFLQSAELCKGFVKTWNVGLEAFDPRLLKNDSKGVNRGPEHASEALELAKRLDYKLYLSGILGLPGTTLSDLRREVDNWLALAETYDGNVTTVSVAAPALVPGSRMYWDTYVSSRELRELHGEILPSRRLSAIYVRENTEVELEDVEAALTELGRGIIEIGERGGGMKFGGYMLGGVDEAEAEERVLLEEAVGMVAT
jgi:radical SAM superfamily enzyme YgiQ (UPF0313 family)